MELDARLAALQSNGHLDVQAGKTVAEERYEVQKQASRENSRLDLGPVKTLTEDCAFVTEVTLATLIDPHNLNSTDLQDIYSQREDDFEEPDTLEVSYMLNGKRQTEMLFVDKLYQKERPRICVSIKAVHAMHRAIAVLTRKIDNTLITLRSCRVGYYKELTHLRELLSRQQRGLDTTWDERKGTFVTNEHVAHFFTQSKYQDDLTVSMFRERIHEATYDLEQQLQMKHAQISKLQNLIARRAYGGDVTESVEYQELEEQLRVLTQEQEELRDELEYQNQTTTRHERRCAALEDDLEAAKKQLERQGAALKRAEETQGVLERQLRKERIMWEEKKKAFQEDRKASDLAVSEAQSAAEKARAEASDATMELEMLRLQMERLKSESPSPVRSTPQPARKSPSESPVPKEIRASVESVEELEALVEQQSHEAQDDCDQHDEDEHESGRSHKKRRRRRKERDEHADDDHLPRRRRRRSREKADEEGVGSEKTVSEATRQRRERKEAKRAEKLERRNARRAKHRSRSKVSKSPDEERDVGTERPSQTEIGGSSGEGAKVAAGSPSRQVASAVQHVEDKSTPQHGNLFGEGARATEHSEGHGSFRSDEHGGGQDSFPTDEQRGGPGNFRTAEHGGDHVHAEQVRAESASKDQEGSEPHGAGGTNSATTDASLGDSLQVGKESCDSPASASSRVKEGTGAIDSAALTESSSPAHAFTTGMDQQHEAAQTAVEQSPPRSPQHTQANEQSAEKAAEESAHSDKSSFSSGSSGDSSESTSSSESFDDSKSGEDSLSVRGRRIAKSKQNRSPARDQQSKSPAGRQPKQSTLQHQIEDIARQGESSCLLGAASLAKKLNDKNLRFLQEMLSRKVGPGQGSSRSRTRTSTAPAEKLAGKSVSTGTTPSIDDDEDHVPSPWTAPSPWSPLLSPSPNEYLEADRRQQASPPSRQLQHGHGNEEAGLASAACSSSEPEAEPGKRRGFHAQPRGQRSRSTSAARRHADGNDDSGLAVTGNQLRGQWQPPTRPGSPRVYGSSPPSRGSRASSQRRAIDDNASETSEGLTRADIAGAALALKIASKADNAARGFRNFGPCGRPLLSARRSRSKSTTDLLDASDLMQVEGHSVHSGSDEGQSHVPWRTSSPFVPMTGQGEYCSAPFTEFNRPRRHTADAGVQTIVTVNPRSGAASGADPCAHFEILWDKGDEEKPILAQLEQEGLLERVMNELMELCKGIMAISGEQGTDGTSRGRAGRVSVGGKLVPGSSLKVPNALQMGAAFLFDPGIARKQNDTMRGRRQAARRYGRMGMVGDQNGIIGVSLGLDMQDAHGPSSGFQVKNVPRLNRFKRPVEAGSQMGDLQICGTRSVPRALQEVWGNPPVPEESMAEDNEAEEDMKFSDEDLTTENSQDTWTTATSISSLTFEGDSDRLWTIGSSTLSGSGKRSVLLRMAGGGSGGGKHPKKIVTKKGNPMEVTGMPSIRSCSPPLVRPDVNSTDADTEGTHVKRLLLDSPTPELDRHIPSPTPRGRVYTRAGTPLNKAPAQETAPVQLPRFADPGLSDEAATQRGMPPGRRPATQRTAQILRHGDLKLDGEPVDEKARLIDVEALVIQSRNYLSGERRKHGMEPLPRRVQDRDPAQGPPRSPVLLTAPEGSTREEGWFPAQARRMSTNWKRSDNAPLGHGKIGAFVR